MSLESYLQALLGRFYSKTPDDNKLLSSQCAMNVEGKVSFSTDGSYVAPFDGFVRISGTSTMPDGEIFIQDSTHDIRFLTMQSNIEGNWMQNIVPIKKGIQYLFGRTNSSATINGVDFFPFSGGGVLVRFFKAEVKHAFA